MESFEKSPDEMESLIAELEEARETLRALKLGQVDALVVTDPDDNNEKIVALQGSQKIAQSIFEQSAEAIVVCDIDGTIVKASEAAHEICSLNPILQPFGHVFPLRLSEEGSNADVRYFALHEILEGKAMRGLEVEFNSASNKRYVFLLSAAPLRDGHGTLQGCIVMLTDVTAQKRNRDELRQSLERERELRAKLQESLEIREQFLAVITHELRNPLTSILTTAQMLLRSGTADDRLRTSLRTIERNAKHQARIVDDLLDIARVASGKLRLDISRVNVKRLIAEQVETMRPSAELKNISLNFSCEDDDSFVNADSERLQQIMGNLLANAIKFTPHQGKITINATRRDSHIEISVCDNGVGIAPELLPHIFERFKQADSAGTRSAGLGLGLAIVRSIVELHQGTVSARSEGLGKGATFTVRIPLAARVTSLKDK